MTDEDIEKIIKSNMSLQMNLAGIRQDFEEKTKREWVGLDIDERAACYEKSGGNLSKFADAIEIKLRSKNENP